MTCDSGSKPGGHSLPHCKRGLFPTTPEEAQASGAEAQSQSRGGVSGRMPVWLGLSILAGKWGWERKMLTSEFRSGVDPCHPLPAEGPVTRQPCLTPAYQGRGVERVLQTGDRARTGLSALARSASLIHTSSEAPQPTYPLRPPACPSLPPLQAACGLCPGHHAGSDPGGCLA